MIVPMPLPSEGGHPFLLPHDYDSLTIDGQRDARLNAVRQWTIPRAPQQAAEALIACYQFFHTYYLREDVDASFHPGFFDDEPLPMAPFHLDIVGANAAYLNIVVGAPRGSAKSTVLEQLRLLKLVSRPLYSFTVGTASSRLCRRWGTRFLLQIDSNARLNDDFGYDFGGRLKPPRGKAPFSTEVAYLNNGSWVAHTTTGSRQRGDRPFEFHFDDPEYDPDGESTSMQRLRDETDRLIFKIIMPMVAREGRRLTWLGTIISRQHLLFKAFSSTTDSFGFDPRFAYWHRMLLRALYRLPSGEEVSIWPEMWSVQKLHEIKASIGPAQFRSEYQNDPGAGEGQYFFLDKRHSYEITNPDHLLSSNPTQSSATISWDRKGQRCSQPLSEFLSSNPVFLTVDSAPTSSVTSDFNAIAVMAITPFNELFVLDIFNRRVKEHVTALEALRLADKWKASVIGVELHSKSQGLYGSLQHLLGTRAESIANISHLPSLRPIRVGYAAKTSRISAMQYRFGDPQVTDPSAPGFGGLVKLPITDPFYLRNPEWKTLFNQISDFNPDANDGGLEHDDALDCLARNTLVLTHRGEVPIQSVLVGDHVLTRQGWKPVLAVWSKGKRPCVRRGPLWATPDHRVWTENRGWVRHTELQQSDTICGWQSETLSSSTECGSTDTPSRKDATSEATTGHTLRRMPLHSLCTERFGRPTLGKFQPDGMSTTSTAIPQTTRSETCGLFLIKTTSRSTNRSRFSGAGPTSSSDPWPGSGPSGPERPCGVASAGPRLRHSKREDRSIAAEAAGAKRPTEETGSGAGTSDPQSPSCRRGALQPEEGGRQDEPVSLEVWDIMVQDCHEFFANGILVHNCVSMSQEVILGLKKKPAKSQPAKTPLELLKEGKTRGPNDEILAHMVQWNSVNNDDRNEILNALRKPTPDAAPSKV